MSSNSPVWAYSLPVSLLLLAPFDILASLAMDIYLPIVPAMPGILNTSPAVIQLTLSCWFPRRTDGVDAPSRWHRDVPK